MLTIQLNPKHYDVDTITKHVAATQGVDCYMNGTTFTITFGANTEANQQLREQFDQQYIVDPWQKDSA